MIHPKKLLLLGGLRYLIPVIEAAHRQGYYVITCDYLPNNIAHKYSDEYINISITDKEAILQAAKQKNIDGIMSFACDPGVIVASYVQEKMGLPSFGPYKSVEILQNKDKFRAFLKENGFNVPWAKGFENIQDALKETSSFSLPCIVKPTDSAGSKGVTRVDRAEDLPPALEHAMQHSISGHIIVEEFIEKKGFSSDTDIFSINGKISFVNYNAQHFDKKAKNPFTPSAYSWPSTYSKKEQQYLTSEIQRLISLLGMKTLVYNVETCIGINGKPYIMEVSPRGGGNRLAEMIRYIYDIDMITAVTRAMVNDPIIPIEQKTSQGHWAEIILHSNTNGYFDELIIENKFGAEIIEKDLWEKKGDRINCFEGANNTIGTLIMKFNSSYEMEKAINNQEEWLKVIVK